MERLRILLCDDQPELLGLLQRILEPDYQVVGTAEHGLSLLAAAHALRPDIVLTDINMPLLNGLEAARELRKQLPDCRIIFHSSHDEPEILAAAFSAGASGYLIKSPSHTLRSTIRAVIQSAWDSTESNVQTRSHTPR